MGIKYSREPGLNNPILIASWPGIGNIGVIAVDTFRTVVGAEELAEIEPWDFFYPKKLTIENGELVDLEFPTSKFYYKKTEARDLMFFIGEDQPSEGGTIYAGGHKAYQLANLVIDVAVRFGCKRIYTSGAAVSAIHHAARSRVWAVPGNTELIAEVRSYRNTVLMSDVEGRRGQGNIIGLNGLLLGVAKKRGLEAICLMGEVPAYLQGFPLPYPKAARSVLEVLAVALGLDIEMGGIEALVDHSEREIERLYERFPLEIREQIERLRPAAQSRRADLGPITEEDQRRILDDIDRFFKSGPKED